MAIVGHGRFGRALSGLLAAEGVTYRAHDPCGGGVPLGATLEAAVKGAHHVVFAVPVERLRDALTAARPHLGPGQLVLDVGSVKLGPVEVMTDVLGTSIPWVGTHPLFGPTSVAGGERPFTVIVCANPLHPDAARRATRLFERLGCQVVEQAPDEHDRLMARTHALAFFLAKGVLVSGGPVDDSVAPPSYRALKRLIESMRSDAGHLLAAIHRENPYATAAREQLLSALVAVDRALREDSAVSTDAAPSLRPGAMGRTGADAERGLVLADLEALDRRIISLLALRARVTRGEREVASVGPPAEARARWARDEGVEPEWIEELYARLLGAPGEDGGAR